MQQQQYTPLLLLHSVLVLLVAAAAALTSAASLCTEVGQILFPSLGTFGSRYYICGILFGSSETIKLTQCRAKLQFFEHLMC